jgi:hypothetical protein
MVQSYGKVAISAMLPLETFLAPLSKKAVKLKGIKEMILKSLIRLCAFV